jgi:hypothetical protein
MKQPKYEYRVERWLGADAAGRGEETLSTLGQHGWELVAVTVQFNEHFAYLKRKS